jgi:hypothetical protein
MQNLANAHLTVWASEVSKVVVPNKSAEFFQEFKDYVTVRQFDYDDAILGTPFEGDPFFGNGTLVKTFTPAAAAYSDVVCLLILNKSGGEAWAHFAPSRPHPNPACCILSCSRWPDYNSQLCWYVVCKTSTQRQPA